jgi:hypothetical protein
VIGNNSKIEPTSNPSDPNEYTTVIIHVNDNATLRGHDASHKTHHFQVYVHGEREIKLEGDKTFRGFIFGDQSELIAEGDSGFSDPLLLGAAWVKEFTSGRNAKISQSLTSAEAGNLVTPARTGLQIYTMTRTVGLNQKAVE